MGGPSPSIHLPLPPPSPCTPPSPRLSAAGPPFWRSRRPNPPLPLLSSSLLHVSMRGLCISGLHPRSPCPAFVCGVSVGPEPSLPGVCACTTCRALCSQLARLAAAAPQPMKRARGCTPNCRHRGSLAPDASPVNLGPPLHAPGPARVACEPRTRRPARPTRHILCLFEPAAAISPPPVPAVWGWCGARSGLRLPSWSRCPQPLALITGGQPAPAPLCAVIF